MKLDAFAIRDRRVKERETKVCTNQSHERESERGIVKERAREKES